MDERTDQGPTRRTVLAGAAAVGAAWSAPIVLSGTPAAAQVSGCALLGATATPVCINDLDEPFGTEFAVTVAGCAGSYSVEIFLDGTSSACVPLPPGGGVVWTRTSTTNVGDTDCVVRLREGPPCSGATIAETYVLGTMPLDCGTSGAAAPSDGTSSPGS